MPLIDLLLQKGHEVLLASDGRALELLRLEFPKLQTLTLPGYQPIYPDSSSMVWAMGRQLPKFINAINKEHKILNQWIKEHSLDAVISDNRYGLYTDKIPCVFITHQLFIQMPIQAAFLSGPINKINHRFISRYNECWVPDWPGEENLAGKLTRGESSLPNTHYVGPQSRLQKQSAETKYDIMVLLSGPEPQRTQLEKKMIHQLRAIENKCLVVQGITESEQETKQIAPHIEMISYLTGAQLSEALAQTNKVVCRSGYSTIMDLVKVQKPAILIPTPGQTEQEYLADHLFMKGYFYFQKQDSLNLEMALEESIGFTVTAKLDLSINLLSEKLMAFIQTL